MMAMLIGPVFSTDKTSGEDTLWFVIVRFPWLRCEGGSSLRRKAAPVTVKLHSGKSASTGNRRRESHRRAGAAPRVQIDLSAQLFGATAHALQSVPLIRLAGDESPAIVFQLEDYLPTLDPERCFCNPASGVARDVIDTFLENQEDLAPHLGIYLHILIRHRSVQMKLDVPFGQAVVGKAAHSVREVNYIVALGIHGPDNVAHGFD